MSLFDQGDVPNDTVFHPDVAKFLATVRNKPICQMKQYVHGTVTTKCGRVQDGMDFVSGWDSEVTCPKCKPSPTK